MSMKMCLTQLRWYMYPQTHVTPSDQTEHTDCFTILLILSGFIPESWFVVQFLLCDYICCDKLVICIGIFDCPCYGEIDLGCERTCQKGVRGSER